MNSGGVSKGLICFQFMSVPKVDGWWTARVRLCNEEVLPAVYRLLAHGDHESYIVYEEKPGTDNHHVHCLFSVVVDRKTRKMLDDRWRHALSVVGCSGNANRSMKQAEHAFKMALGYIAKDGNRLKSVGIFTDEMIEDALCSFADHKAKLDKEQAKVNKERAVKFKCLKRCREEDVKPHMKTAIGGIVFDVVKEAAVIYSMRQMQDLCLFLKMQLMDKGESYERTEMIEMMTRFM